MSLSSPSLSSRLQLSWKDNRISRYVSSFLILVSIQRGHGSTCHVTFHSWTLIIQCGNVCFCCLHPLCSSRLGRRNVAQARAFGEEDDDDDDDVFVTFSAGLAKIPPQAQISRHTKLKTSRILPTYLRVWIIASSFSSSGHTGAEYFGIMARVHRYLACLRLQ